MLDRVQFGVVHDSTAEQKFRNDYNNVFWDDDVYGEAFGESTLAITWWRYLGARTIEADVIFNDKWPYNSYRGPLKTAASGGTLWDFHRIAMHEFGHVLGLSHPGEHGQNVRALMHSTSSDVNDLQDDDIRGVRWIYDRQNAVGAVQFPPRDQTFDFRAQLESKYRYGMGRPSQNSFADVEGVVMWTQEYLHYRLHQCSHERVGDAVDWQIEGLGALSVCGSPPAGLPFPPRNETFAFREHLETVYKDDLGRGAAQTYVDREGDVIWISEYIPYRLTGCGHADATSRVMQQIDGRGVQPPCR